VALLLVHAGMWLGISDGPLANKPSLCSLGYAVKKNSLLFWNTFEPILDDYQWLPTAFRNLDYFPNNKTGYTSYYTKCHNFAVKLRLSTVSLHCRNLNEACKLAYNEASSSSSGSVRVRLWQCSFATSIRQCINKSGTLHLHQVPRQIGSNY